eukprot:gene9143-11209_t
MITSSPNSTEMQFKFMYSIPPQGPNVFNRFTLELVNDGTGSKNVIRNFANLTCTTIINPIESAIGSRVFHTEKGIEALIILGVKGRKIYYEYTCIMDCFRCEVKQMGNIDSNVTISILPPQNKECRLSKNTTTIKFGIINGPMTSIDFPLISPEKYPTVFYHYFSANNTNFNISKTSDSLDTPLEIDLYGAVEFYEDTTTPVIFDNNNQYAYRVGEYRYITKTRFNSNSAFSFLKIFYFNTNSIPLPEQKYYFTQISNPQKNLVYTQVPTTGLPYPLVKVSSSDPIYYTGKKLSSVNLNGIPTAELPLFYGYSIGNVQNYIFGVTEVFTTLGQNTVSYSFQPSIGFSLGFIPNEKGQITIKKAQIFLIGSEYKFFVSLSDSSNGGVRFYNNYQQIFSFLIRGNSTYGDYLIPFDPSIVFQFKFINSDNQVTYIALLIPVFLPNTNFYFGGPHDYYLSEKGETIYLDFNLSNQIKSFIPILSVMFFKDYYVDFEGSWNSNKNLFTIPIHLPKNLLPDLLSYRFKNLFMGGGLKIIDMIDLYSVFSDDALLKVNTERSDVMPPIVTKLDPYMDTRSYPPVIGWVIGFSDEINGFKEANITVNSDFDKIPHVFNLKLEDKIGGGVNDPEFDIKIPVTTSNNYYQGEKKLVVCKTQVFSIISVISHDQGAGLGSSKYIDPLIRFINHLNLNIIFECPDNSKITVDETSPSIDSIISPTKMINSLGNHGERTFMFRFIARDANGIYPRFNPTVFIHSQFMAPIGFPTYINNNTDNNPNTSQTYYCTVVVPFNYGNQFILLSIGGVFDTFLNIRGLSHLDILPSVPIINITQTNTPIIDYHSKTIRSEGIVTIYGKNFPTDKNKLKVFTSSFIVDPKDIQLSDLLPYFILSYPLNAGANFSIYISCTYENGLTLKSYPFLIVTTDDIIPTETPSQTPSATPTQTPTQTPSSTPEPKIE